MKRLAYFTLCSLFCFSACEQADENVTNEENDENVENVAKPTELYCAEIPGTHITEADVIDSLSHEALMEIVDGLVYQRTAAYNCFERNDSVFYVVQPRDGIDENNLNCIALLIGEPIRYLSIADSYVTHWIEHCEYAEAYHLNYKYNPESQMFEDFLQVGYTVDVNEFKVQYVDKEYLVLHSDVAYNASSNHNTAAQFSRIVYKAVDRSVLPDCDIIDRRN